MLWGLDLVIPVALAEVDPSADPLETIEAWLKTNDPDVLAQLGWQEIV